MAETNPTIEELMDDPRVRRRRADSRSDIWCLYFELALFGTGRDAPVSFMKVCVYDKTLETHRRNAEARDGRWTTRSYGSFEELMDAIKSTISNVVEQDDREVALVDDILVAELPPDSNPESFRYTSAALHQSMYGVIPEDLARDNDRIKIIN